MTIKTQKIKNPILISAAGSFVLSPVLPTLPYALVQAKEIADIWPYEERNLPSDIGQNASSGYVNSMMSFSNDVIPVNFNIPSVGDANMPIEYIDARLNYKGIQNISFINLSELKYIGGNFKYTLTTTQSIFTGNEIRKIYWNKSDFYKNDITINTYAFNNNQIAILDLPNKVVSIGLGAFSDNRITRITGWENLKTLGGYAFRNNQLVSYANDGYVFELPRNSYFKEIPASAFAGNLLTSVVIPENVTKISDSAFYDNPITSIEFENPNTIISNKLFDDSTVSAHSDITVYGRGDSSTAKTFATKIQARYVNVDAYDVLVEAAEESLTDDTFNAAYAAVTEMVDSLTKTNYLDRLETIKSSSAVADSVIKSEQSLSRVDYKAAKTEVDKIETIVIRQKYNQRLERVLIAIEGSELDQLKAEYDEMVANGILTIEKVKEIEEGLAKLTMVDTSELTTSLATDRDSALANSFNLLKERVELIETSLTMSNVLKAESLLESIPDGYSVEFTNADGNVVTITKQDLKDELDLLSPPIYAKTAVEIAEKYLTQPKIDEAYILVGNLTDSSLKAQYYAKLNDLDVLLSEVAELDNSINRAIVRAKTTLSNEDIDVVSALIELLPNNTIKAPYLEQVETLKTKQSIKRLVREIELLGINYDRLDSLTVLTALIPELDPENLKYADQVLNYKEMLDNENANKAKITDIMNGIDPFDVESLTIEKYNELAALIRNLSDEVPEKVAYQRELGVLLQQLTTLQTDKQAYDLIKEQINDLDNDSILDKTELDNIWAAISQLPNAKSVEKLKVYFNEAVSDLVKDQLGVNFNSPENKTADYINYSKGIIDSIHDNDLKSATKTEFNNEIQRALTDDINNFSTFDTEHLKDLKEMIKNIDDNTIKTALNQQLDQKASDISRDISNTMNIDESTPQYITNLQDFISNISDSSVRTSAYNNVDESINSELKNYFAGSSSLTENDIDYLQDILNSYYNSNNFNNYSDNTVKNLLEDYFVSNFTTVINTNSGTSNGSSSSDGSDFSSTSVTTKEEIAKVAEAEKFLSDFGDAVFTNNYKDQVEQKLGDLLKEQIKEIQNNTITGTENINDTIKIVEAMSDTTTAKEILDELVKTLGTQTEKALKESAKSISETGDASKLIDILNSVKEMPQGTTKEALQAVTDNFLEKNINLLQNGKIPADQLVDLNNYKEIKVENDSTKETVTSDNSGQVEKLINEVEALKKLIELLNQMDDNKTPSAPSDYLDNLYLSSLLSKLSSNNNGQLTQLVSDKTLIEKLNASENKVESLTAVISDLQSQLEDYKEQLTSIEDEIAKGNQNLNVQLATIEDKVDEGNSTVEERQVSLQAQLVSKDNEMKDLKNQFKVSSGILLILMSAYGIVSVRNNRKLLAKLTDEIKELKKDDGNKTGNSN